MQEKAVETHKKNVLTRSGWSKVEEELFIERLSKAAHEGTALSKVFSSMAIDTGRKPNSVRNYYYTAIRSHIIDTNEPALARRDHKAFTTFTDDENRQLLRLMLTKQASGTSVRACSMELGTGNRSRMLRYQNKYRSLVKNRRTLVEEVMRSLDHEGIAYFNPFGGEEKKPVLAETEGGDGHTLAHDLLAVLNREAGINLVELLKLMNEFVVRISHEEELDLKNRIMTSEERADNLKRKLKQLTESAKGYLAAKDSSQLTKLQQMLQEIKDLELVQPSGSTFS